MLALLLMGAACLRSSLGACESGVGVGWVGASFTSDGRDSSIYAVSPLGREPAPRFLPGTQVATMASLHSKQRRRQYSAAPPATAQSSSSMQVLSGRAVAEWGQGRSMGAPGCLALRRLLPALAYWQPVVQVCACLAYKQAPLLLPCLLPLQQASPTSTGCPAPAWRAECPAVRGQPWRWPRQAQVHLCSLRCMRKAGTPALACLPPTLRCQRLCAATA